MKPITKDSYMHTKCLIVMMVTLLLSGCVPESKKVLTEVNQNFASPDFQKVTSYQHSMQTDSLMGLLDDKDPTTRFLATRAFASHQDPKALDKLYTLLDDPVIKVRSMAAYAIGQIGSTASEPALIEGFRQRDTMSVDNAANGEILASLGKISELPIAKFITDAENYQDKDTLLLEGRLRSLYNFGLRGITDPAITQYVVDAVRNPNLSDKARLYAAHYMARTKDLDIEKVQFQIAEAFVDEQDPIIKMALATALKHTSNPEILSTLINQLDLEQDYRVVCNIIRSLSSYEGEAIVPSIVKMLRSDNVHIARTAAEYISKVGDPADAYKYRDVAKDSIAAPVKTAIYEAIFSRLPHYYEKTKNATRWQVQQALAKESDTYNKIGYLKALGQDPSSYDYIMKYSDTTNNVIIKTAAMDALGSILAHKDFNAIYQSVARSNRRKILNHVREGIASNDEGIIGAAANIIADPESGLKELIDSTDFLSQAKASLKLPGQVESVHAVERALAHLRGVTKPNLTKLDNFKSLDWHVLKEMTGNSKAIIKTTKGIFSIQFFPNEAPETVQNFISLSNKDFYDGMVFHRVVPNFVIQTGSPRGDNYGGADYVIRSELGPRAYDGEGYVGMASAGPHTESTQWFVTHSPTPHLNGKYTIFAQVIEGMDVVHNIQVGDQITDIIISHL